MKMAHALIWKEWRELRWFLIAGLTILLVFPLIEAIDRYNFGFGRGFNSDMPEGMVLGFGGLLAIFVAVGATCRDLKPDLQTFWQSRPISLKQWLAIKYLAGLIIVLLICCIPLLIQIIMFAARRGLHQDFTFRVLSCHTFTIVLIYSVSFLLGCLVGRAAHAAILSIAAGMLIYFGPMIIPPLGFLSVFNILLEAELTHSVSYGAGYAAFVITMLAASAVAALLAFKAVRNNWRLGINHRLICWTLGGIVLALLAGASFQVGSNLPCRQRIKMHLPDQDYVVDSILMDDQTLLVLYRHRSSWQDSGRYSLRRFDLTKQQFVAESEIQLRFDNNSSRYRERTNQLIWLPDQPMRAYVLRKIKVDQTDGSLIEEIALWTLALDSLAEDKVTSKLNLSAQFPDANRLDGFGICTHEQTIYVACRVRSTSEDKVLVIDVKNPDALTVAQVIDVDNTGFSFNSCERSGWLSDVAYLHLLPLPNLTDHQRFEVSSELVRQEGPAVVGTEGDLVVAVTDRELATYRLIGFEGDSARLEKVGRRTALPLERFWPLRTQAAMVSVQDGFAFLSNWFRGITVFDVRRPEHPKRIGHYAAPEGSLFKVDSLSDGRILVSGQDLHILTLPKRN